MRFSNAATIIGLAAAILLTPGELRAQPALTTIQDTLYKADGAPFEGLLRINWRSFEGPDAENVPTNNLTVRVTGGRLHIRLVPTTTAPKASYYSVRYVASGAVQFTEIWSVPQSATPLRVRDVRIEWPPMTTAMAAELTNVTIQDVEGLPAALDARPVKGAGYTASRAAVISASGELEAATGSPGDCVRVDGTSAPCSSGAAAAIGFVDSETPLGTVDGANATFTLGAAPNPAGSLKLFRNGLLQKQGLDYTLTGNTITFLGAAIPQPGDVLLADYRTGGN